MPKTLRRVLKWSAVTIGVVVFVAVAALAAGYFMSDNECGSQAVAEGPATMKAIVYCDYGSPSVLRVETIEKPKPNDDQVLVRVRAASVNPLDYHYMRGTPYFIRLDTGLRKPKVMRLGVDFAGTIEAVGKKVARFKPGDEVFGTRNGAFGEYIAVREQAVVAKPSNATFEQAAAMPVAAVTALQALRDKGKVHAGQRVLINGASGGVGTFAVQIAKSLGANVTGVCSTRNVQLVRSVGADEVIDYTKQDFTSGAQKYDVIVDMVGNHPLSSYRRVLQRDGKYVMVGGPKGNWVKPMDRLATMAMLSPFVSQDFGMVMAKVNPSDLEVLRDLVQAGKITSVIDRRYSLADVPKAMEYIETGRARGKVVITID